MLRPNVQGLQASNGLYIHIYICQQYFWSRMRPGYWIKVMAVWRGLEWRLIYVTLLTLLIALFQATAGCLMSTSISKKRGTPRPLSLQRSLSHTLIHSLQHGQQCADLSRLATDLSIERKRTCCRCVKLQQFSGWLQLYFMLSRILELKFEVKVCISVL